MTIDDAYEEAALMDGANYLQILIKVIVPLSKPIIATIALWTAVDHWNAWFDALIYMHSESKIVLQLLLRRLLHDAVNMAENLVRYSAVAKEEIPSQGVTAAITMLTIGPIILVYPFLQKYFMKGIFIGSLKG
jgi:putative aldouronate transport system permease protein